MTKKLTFLSIIVLLSSCGLGQMSMAQSNPDRNSAAAQGPAKQKTYEFRSIDYPGAYRSYASDFDDGMVVGRAFSTDTSGAFYYRGTSYYPVNVPGAIQSQIEGINSSGQMVGHFADNAGDHGPPSAFPVETTP
jgi:hypothetical protein